jgi:hypothetical protein
MCQRVQSLERKFSDAQPQAVAAPATVTFGAAPRGPFTSKIQAPPLPDYGASRADAGAAPAPPQHAPPDAGAAPAPPQHAPPDAGAHLWMRVESDLIIDNWMPEHPHFMMPARPWESPPGQRGRCQHKQPQWFTRYFDPNTSESRAYFVGRRDVGDDIWVNRLQRACASVQTCFELPYHGTSLFTMMMDRPDLLFQWHNTNSGGFYFCIGCANCSSVTGHYQPHNQVDPLGLNPDPEFYKLKAMKELACVRAAFRAFLAKVLDAPILAVGEKCRHLHQDTPPLALENMQ